MQIGDQSPGLGSQFMTNFSFEDQESTVEGFPVSRVALVD
jgi:hypothetical protein